MDITEYLQLLANFFVRQIPTLIVASFGLWFAIGRRQRLGRVSAWAIWGFALLIVYSFVTVLLQYFITTVQISQISMGARAESLTRLGLLALAAHPIFIAALALLARAIFLDRNTGGELGLRQQSIGSIE